MPPSDALRVVARRVGFKRKRLARGFRKAAGASAALVLAAFAGMALLGAQSGAGVICGLVALYGFLAGPLLLLAGWIASLSFGTRKDVTVVLDGEGLALEAGRRRLLVRRDDAVTGIVLPRDGAWDVEIETRAGDVADVRVADEATADRMLGAMGLDASQRRTTVRYARLFHRIIFGFATFVLTSWAVMGLASLAGRLLHIPGAAGFAMLAVYPLAILLVSPVNQLLAWHEYTVGLDGLSVRSGLSRRFIPFADVVRAEEYGETYVYRGEPYTRLGGIDLIFADGHRERVPVKSDAPDVRRALLSRIRRALGGKGQGAEGRGTLELLARCERSLAAWREAVHELVRGGAYRERALRVEDVTGVLDDPSASAEHRIGAALALVGSGDPEAPARVRIAADACAAPALREALVGLADGEVEDEAIEAAVRVA